MINEKELIKTFIEMVKIPSPSFKEGKFAKYLTAKLKSLGCSIYVDKSAKHTGSDTGNIIAKLKGNIKSKPILLSAHMDTVGPCQNIKPKFKGNKIITDGKTILGADCKAGIAAILETLKILKEKKLSHPPLEIVLTAAEETGMCGSKNLDYSKIKSKYGIVLDANIEDTAVTKAAAKNVFEITIEGIAAHAAMSPEKGISALSVAANIINSFKMGKLDNETTANISTLTAETTTNVVPPLAKMKGEIRSLNNAKLAKQVKLLEKICKDTKKKFTKKIDGKVCSPKISLNINRQYFALNAGSNTPVMKALAKSSEDMGIKLKTAAVPAGSDANIMAELANISSVLIDTGMEKVHSVNEYLEIKRLVKCTKLLLGAVLNFKN